MGYYQDLANKLREELLSGQRKLPNPNAFQYAQLQAQQQQAELDRKWQERQAELNRQAQRDMARSSMYGSIAGPLAGAAGLGLFGGLGGGGAGTAAGTGGGLFGGIGDAISGLGSSLGSALGLGGGGAGAGGITGTAEAGYSLGMANPFSGAAGASMIAPEAGGMGAGLLGSLLPAAGLAAGGYLGYQQLKGAKDALSGNNLSTMGQAALAPVTGGFSLAYNPVKKAIGGLSNPFGGGGPSAESLDRSALRQEMQRAGIANADERMKNTSYNLNLADEGVDQLIGAADPLAEIMASRTSRGEEDKQQRLREQGTGYLVNEAKKEGGDPQANIRRFYEDAGITPDVAKQEVMRMFRDGEIDEDRRDAYLASIDRTFA